MINIIFSLSYVVSQYYQKHSKIIVKTDKPQPMLKIEPNLNDFFPPLIYILKFIIILFLIMIIILFFKIIINSFRK